MWGVLVLLGSVIDEHCLCIHRGRGPALAFTLPLPSLSTTTTFFVCALVPALPTSLLVSDLPSCKGTHSLQTQAHAQHPEAPLLLLLCVFPFNQAPDSSRTASGGCKLIHHRYTSARQSLNGSFGMLALSTPSSLAISHSFARQSQLWRPLAAVSHRHHGRMAAAPIASAGEL